MRTKYLIMYMHYITLYEKYVSYLCLSKLYIVIYLSLFYFADEELETASLYFFKRTFYIQLGPPIFGLHIHLKDYHCLALPKDYEAIPIWCLHYTLLTTFLLNVKAYVTILVYIRMEARSSGFNSWS